MRIIPLIASAAGLALVASAAAAQETAPSTQPATPDIQQIEGIAAIVNDHPISYSDVRQRARLLLLSLGAQPSQDEVRQIAGQALEQLIDERLQLQEAAEYEVEIGEDEIAAAIDDMAAGSGLTREQLYQQLIAAGVNPASLEDQMRAEIAWRRIMGGLYGSRIRISENQIDDQLDRLRAASQETSYLLSEIFLFAPDPDSRAQALEAANSIRSQVLQGAPFQVAAQRFSSSPTAATGGDMGWVTLDDLDAPVAAAISAMEQPGLTEPVIVDDGIYIVALRNRRDPEEAVSQVSLKRLLSPDSDRTALQAATAEIAGCEDVERVAETAGLQAATLGRITLDQLAPDAAERIEATPVDTATEIFEASGGLAVMYVCDRTERLDALPTPAQIENQLYGRQLTMIAERSLRNLRREATIIQRN